MILLLPPSETKNAGGDGPPLDLSSLVLPEQMPVRDQLCTDLTALCTDEPSAVRALKLGPTQFDALRRNREIRSSGTMSALLRYTGVLYDALDATSLNDTQWDCARDTLLIQSALFGLIGAADLIPDYRLSCDSRLTPSLKKRWVEVGREILERSTGTIIDLRSEGYAALAPLPSRTNAHGVRVVTRTGDGQVRALNHFNKQAKGLFVRAVLEAGTPLRSTNDLLTWAADEGYELSLTADGALQLVVPTISGRPGALRARLRSA